MTPAFNKHVGG